MSSGQERQSGKFSAMAERGKSRKRKQGKQKTLFLTKGPALTAVWLLAAALFIVAAGMRFLPGVSDLLPFHRLQAAEGEPVSGNHENVPAPEEGRNGSATPEISENGKDEKGIENDLPDRDEGEGKERPEGEQNPGEAAGNGNPELVTGESPEETDPFSPERFADCIPIKEASEQSGQSENSGKNVLTLCFAGDILFDHRYSIMASMNQRAGQEPPIESAMDEGLLEIMRSADIFMVNNEFTYTDRGTPTAGKAFTFSAHPRYVRLLHEMGADIVSLANNHTYDYGQEGFLDTLDTLEQAGMPYVGAGRNLEEASAVRYFTNGRVKLAFVSATQIERMANPDTRGAGEDTPGVFRFLKPELFLQRIAEARENSDFVIAYVHWGTESTTELDHYQKEAAARIAGAGADLIIGDHPHVLQKIDLVDGVPVIYSLGNFLFNSKTQDSCLIQVQIDGETAQLISFRFIPSLQTGCRAKLAQGNEKERILASMRALSSSVVLDEDGFLQLK